MATPPVHSSFADWYRTAGIEPDSATLAKRWKGAVDFDVGGSETIELACIFFGVSKPTKKFLEAFRGSLQKADPAVPTKSNAHELRVLAGAALVDAIERGDEPLADLAALSLVAGAGQNVRTTPPVPEIPEIAARYLSSRGARRESPSESEFEEFDQKLIEDIATQCATNAPENLGAPLQKLADEVKRVYSATGALQQQLRLQSEETNILWWLFGAHSRDLRRRFADLPLPAVCIIAGKELCDLALVIPGPPAAIAFLDQILRLSKPKLPKSISLRDAINNTPHDWRAELGKNRWSEPLLHLMPVMNGIKISLTVGEGEDWGPAFKHAAGIDADINLPPTDLAYQTYLEALLSRARAQIE
jgi:hypothetical protein